MGGGLLLYVRVDIPTKLLKTFIAPDNFEGFFIELNLRKKKYLLSCSYNPHKNLIKNHVNTLSREFEKPLATKIQTNPLVLT